MPGRKRQLIMMITLLIERKRSKFAAKDFAFAVLINSLEHSEFMALSGAGDRKNSTKSVDCIRVSEMSTTVVTEAQFDPFNALGGYHASVGAFCAFILNCQPNLRRISDPYTRVYTCILIHQAHFARCTSVPRIATCWTFTSIFQSRIPYCRPQIIKRFAIWKPAHPWAYLSYKNGKK